MTDKQILAFDEAMERVGDDVDFFFELVDMFFTEFAKTEVALASSVASQSFDEIESLAHSSRSALGNLGAMRAYEAASDLEVAGREKISDDIGTKFNSLLAEIKLFKAAVEEKRK